MSDYLVKIVQDKSTCSGLIYTLTVKSRCKPAVSVCWTGYGSREAARRSVAAAQIMLTEQLAGGAR